jgi:uncharacterized protein
MLKPNVYFAKITQKKQDYAEEALTVFTKLLAGEKIQIGDELPLKVHPGEPGNTSYNKPVHYDKIIDFLLKENIKTYFIETNTVTGNRTNKKDHLQVIKDHGFTRVPFVIADGEKGIDDKAVPVIAGHHFKTAKIATHLADKDQVLVLSHFKGHVCAGFGAAIKMLGIGFASRRGKMEAHTINTPPDDGTINWADRSNLQPDPIFRERMAEYAAAASVGKKHIYINFVINLVTDCDCDGHPMEPIYEDLGIFASIDPLALDKACFDELARREGKKPFDGEEMFEYALKLKLGFLEYQLITV